MRRRAEGTASRVVEEHVHNVLNCLCEVAEDEDVDPGQTARKQLSRRVRESHLREDDVPEHERAQADRRHERGVRIRRGKVGRKRAGPARRTSASPSAAAIATPRPRGRRALRPSSSARSRLSARLPHRAAAALRCPWQADRTRATRPATRRSCELLRARRSRPLQELCKRGCSEPCLRDEPVRRCLVQRRSKVARASTRREHDHRSVRHLRQRRRHLEA